jgi:erythromycin esterase-like protein
MAERKRVCAALAGSYEAMFHAAQLTRFLLTWREGDTATNGWRDPRLERAIGVIYRPEAERMSHYFRARLVEPVGAGAAPLRKAARDRHRGNAPF